MSILEVEMWELSDGVDEETHDAAIREWFEWVRDRPDLFAEWKSARHYRHLTEDEREPSGRYIMVFEFHSLAARDAYKERRRDWTGPYAAYKEIDPYRLFDHSSVTVDFWEPRQEDLWLEF